MTKKQVFEHLDKLFEGETLEETYRILNALKNHWIQEYHDNRFKDYDYCPNCKKYSKKDEFEVVEEREKHYRTIYGDFVTYDALVRKYICPKCKEVADKELLESHVIDIE